MQWLTFEKTDHTLRSGQRGFAYVKAVPWRALMKDNKLHWWALIEWENSGNTPISPTNLSLSCPSIEGGGDLMGDPYWVKKTPTAMRSASKISIQLGPKQSKFGGNCEFLADDVKRMQDKKITQYFIGEAKYVDVYGETHVTRFCEMAYSIKGDPLSGGNIEVASIPCLRHNCSDSSCDKEDAQPDLPPETFVVRGGPPKKP